MSAPGPAVTPDSPDAAAAADQAVALDMLLVDGALWPAIRLLPANAAVRLVLEVARHPGGALRRAGELAEELGRVALGTSELAPGPKDRRFADEACEPEFRWLPRVRRSGGEEQVRVQPRQVVKGKLNTFRRTWSNYLNESAID
jgi:hypothetical protein